MSLSYLRVFYLPVELLIMALLGMPIQNEHLIFSASIRANLVTSRAAKQAAEMEAAYEQKRNN